VVASTSGEENVNSSERTSYAPSWYTTTMVPAAVRGPLTFDLDVDVCVIGGGLAGLTTAREIARRGWSVAVLETRRIAWNASGRNDGFVLPGFAESMERIVARVGLEHAKALWALSEMGLKYVRTAIAEARMPGVAPIAGWLKVSKIDNGDEVLAAVQLYGQELGAEVEGWPTERVRDVLKSNHYFHAMHLPRAFHIHPLNYALGLAEAAEAAGARIFEDTPALSIDVEGVRKRISTPSARVRAAHIVLACNVHLGSLVPRIVGTLVPIWSYVITTAPLGPRLAEAVAYRGAVTDTDLANSHYRIVDGDRLLWSGHSTTWEAEPRKFVKRLQADIAEVYPQLGEVAVDHVWSGVLGNALHRMPQIGELSPGLWLASGFGGHGLNTTAMAGNILAQAIVEGDDTWRLFAPFELVWAGGRVGRAAMQVYYWWFNARERFEARQARQREQEYRRVAELAALRAGEERADVEARLGAVVPREELPEEPTLAELPADPVIARETVHAALASEASGQRGDPVARAHSASEDARERADDTRPEPGSSARDDGRRLARAHLPDVSFVQDEDNRAQDRPADRARTKRTF
jgi:gamma-glutamylputrescine oxidase